MSSYRMSPVLIASSIAFLGFYEGNPRPIANIFRLRNNKNPPFQGVFLLFLANFRIKTRVKILCAESSIFVWTAILQLTSLMYKPKSVKKITSLLLVFLCLISSDSIKLKKYYFITHIAIEKNSWGNPFSFVYHLLTQYIQVRPFLRWDIIALHSNSFPFLIKLPIMELSDYFTYSLSFINPSFIMAVLSLW